MNNNFSYTNISTATTTTINTSAGFLHSITVNTTAAGAITVYDNSAASGTKVATLKASVGEQTFIYDVCMTNTSKAITIVTAAASDITVGWR